MKNNCKKDKYYKKQLGLQGEENASNFLKRKGYMILVRNFYSSFGEIDIIAKDGNEYVFVEVKTRTSNLYGEPIEAVDINKQKHIIKATKYFIHKYKLENQYIRFDVIEVYIKYGKVKINHIKNIFG